MLMGQATSSMNEYELIDDSTCDIELELIENIKFYEGLTLEESINKRFPCRQFDIKCFQNSAEIDSKPFVKLDKVTFSRVRIDYKRQDTFEDVVVVRSPGQKYIRFCDVIDELISRGYTNKVYDLYYDRTIYINSAIYEEFYQRWSGYNEQKVRFYDRLEIVSYNTYNTFPITKCENCRENGYKNNAISDKLSHTVECRFKTMKPYLDETIEGFYCGDCCTKESYKSIEKNMTEKFYALVRAERAKPVIERRTRCNGFV
jgi:hypothetical protein